MDSFEPARWRGMSNFFCYLGVAAVALVCPAAMLADFTQSNVTLQSGQNFNLENGAITNTGGDFAVQWHQHHFCG